MRKLIWPVIILLIAFNGAALSQNEPFKTFLNGLSAASTLGGSEVIPCLQSAVTKGCTPAQIKTYVGAGTPGGSNTQLQYNNSAAFGGVPIQYSAANTLFGFGGLTSSFAALQQGSVHGPFGGQGLSVRLADDSDWSFVSGLGLALMNGSTSYGFVFGNSSYGIDMESLNASGIFFRAVGGGGNGRFDTDGILTSLGSVASIAGCSAGTIVGGEMAGTFVIGATSCNVTITVGVIEPTGLSCFVNDRTTAAANATLHQISDSQTTAVIAIPSTATASDVINWGCVGY